MTTGKWNTTTTCTAIHELH